MATESIKSDNPSEEIVPYDDIDFMILPPTEPVLRNIHEIYRVSEDTLNLRSELNRTVFAENLLYEEDPKKVRHLSNIAMDVYVGLFSGPKTVLEIDNKMDPLTQIKYYNLLDISLPIQKIITIESDIYWRRVFIDQTKEKLLILPDRLKTAKRVNWKSLAIQEKYREVLETAEYEGFDVEGLEKLGRMVAPYMLKLRINHLVPCKEHSFDRDTNLKDHNIKNFVVDQCNHINLSVLGELANLEHLRIEFGPASLNYDYHSRFFDFTTNDIRNLGIGMSRLPKLHTLKISRSRMGREKLEILVEYLNCIPLRTLELSYCQLTDNCSYCLYQIMNENLGLHSLELCGNYLGALAMTGLSYGIQNFQGYLCYLGLARNPISDAGLIMLGRGLYDTRQVSRLDCCGLQITDTGCHILSELIKMHHTLEELNMGALPVGEDMGNYIIKAVYLNRSIIKLEARACDMTDEQEYRLKLLVDRNNYLKENPYIETLDISKSTANLPDLWIAQKRPKVLEDVEKVAKAFEECKLQEIDDGLTDAPYLTMKRVKSVFDIIPEYSFGDRRDSRLLFQYNAKDFLEKMFVEHCKLAQDRSVCYFTEH